MSQQGTLQPVLRVEGRGVAVRGNDIDTDRIIPARFMKVVTFEGIEAHVFEDMRTDRTGASQPHPFDRPEHQGANILIVNKNFGCGSSREHAPQALHRWGIDAIVGESFAEIFHGNCVALGVPLIELSADDVQVLQALVESAPQTLITIDVEAATVTAAGNTYRGKIQAAAQQQFITGTWDALAVLLDAGDAIEATAARLPYVNGFAT